jgi:hypothetical protein
MVRQSTLLHIGSLTTATLVALAMGVTCAGAASSRHHQRSEIIQNTIAGPPVMAIVSIKDQRVSLYDANGGALRARVSTGRTDYETPVGIYSVLEKQEEHYSNVYDDASMPFMQRITWSGLSLHGGVLPGYPASHGCVRMPNDFAKQIFPLTKIGMRVIVAHDDVAPVEISHPLLLKPPPAVDESVTATSVSYDAQGPDRENGSPFQPNVRNWPTRQAQLEALKAIAADKSAEADDAIAHADELNRVAAMKFSQRGKAAKALRIAEFAKRAVEEKLAQVERELNAAKSPAAIKNWEKAKAKAVGATTNADAKLAAALEKLQLADEEHARAKQASVLAGEAKAAAVSAAQEAKRKTLPVSLFISLRTQRLYVRQGYQPVFDAPVTIAEPDKPMGTYIYTAVDYMNQGKDLRWTVVSPRRPTWDKVGGTLDRKRSRSDKPLSSEVGSAAAALDRVTLPPDVVARVSGSVWSGSSLIVSDEEMSKETGQATDFVVLISGEPQGGLKKRRRQAPTARFDRYNVNDRYYGDHRYRMRGYRGNNTFFNFFNW